MAKYNKQGILDLNHLKGKSVGRKLDLPDEPEKNTCKHRETITLASGHKKCLDCDEVVGGKVRAEVFS